MSSLQELFDRAIALHQGGNLVAAERLYQQALLMEPGSFAPRHMLGVIRFQQGRSSEAIDLITAALKRNLARLRRPGSIWAMCRPRRRAEEADRQLTRMAASSLRPPMLRFSMRWPRSCCAWGGRRNRWM